MPIQNTKDTVVAADSPKELPASRLIDCARAIKQLFLLVSVRLTCELLPFGGRIPAFSDTHIGLNSGSDGDDTTVQLSPAQPLLFLSKFPSACTFARASGIRIKFLPFEFPCFDSFSRALALR